MDLRVSALDVATRIKKDLVGDTQLLKVTGNDFDIEKMTVDSLADGLAVKVEGDTFKRSGIPNSRFEILHVLRNGRKRLIHFGDRRYGQYRDKLRHYSNLDHNDEQRRRLYYARHGPSEDKNTSVQVCKLCNLVGGTL